MHAEDEITYVVASDVSSRDGIGLETYVNGEQVMEIFRDDTERRTYVSLFKADLKLSVVELSIARFKESIDPDYIE